MRFFLNGAGLLLVLGLLAGCGASLTGGSVPLGTGTVSGTVSRATAPDETVADVPLTLVASDGQTFTTVSQADGTFVFRDVPPGPARLTVSPRPHHGLRRMQMSLVIGAGQTTDVSVALVPEGTTVSVTSITVTPDRVTLRVGQMQSFTATLTGENVAGLAPTWVVDGGIGRISPHGMFMAERPGAGRVRALANGAEGSATVTVTGG